MVATLSLALEEEEAVESGGKKVMNLLRAGVVCSERDEQDEDETEHAEEPSSRSSTSLPDSSESTRASGIGRGVGDCVGLSGTDCAESAGFDRGEGGSISAASCPSCRPASKIFLSSRS